MTLPDGFERCVVSENERPEIFLSDELRFQFENSIADSYFLISRQADRIDHWVGEVVDELDRRIRISEPGVFAIACVVPVGDVNAGLDLVGHAKFKFVAEIDLIDPRGIARAPPGKPILHLDTSRRGSRRFINKREVSCAAEN